LEYTSGINKPATITIINNIFFKPFTSPSNAEETNINLSLKIFQVIILSTLKNIEKISTHRLEKIILKS